MADLTTSYMGLKLNSPLILGSSTISKNLNALKDVEQAGAGAVILKSLFEEELKDNSEPYGEDFHPEAYDYLMNDAALLYGSTAYIEHLENIKSYLSIPVIASINCVGGSWWVDFAKEIQMAGADGIELNIAKIPFRAEESSANIEMKYYDILKSVKDVVDIPVSVKIGQNFTSIPNVVKNLELHGADAVTIFNRYYQMQIDTEKMELMPVHFYSSEAETYNVLRWAAILSSQIGIDISCTTGIHSGQTALQHLLAGASCAQIVSAVYKEGAKVFTEANKYLSDWMDKNSFADMASLKGHGVQKTADDIRSFERIQYMRVAEGKII